MGMMIATAAWFAAVVGTPTLIMTWYVMGRVADRWSRGGHEDDSEGDTRWGKFCSPVSVTS